MAKAYDHKTAAFIGFLIQNMPEVEDEIMNGWMDNPVGTKEFLSGLNPPETIPAKPTPLLSVVATTALGEIAGKKTRACFTGSRYPYGCDADFDHWLPAKQPNTAACVISTLAPAKDWTFVEGAAAIRGIGAGTDIVLLGTALIENGHIMTLAQAEQMVEKTERNENTKMRVDGYGNLFFVETGDPKNPVSVGLVFRDDRDWHAYVLLLDYDFRWHAGRRLLIRNLKDTLKLGR